MDSRQESTASEPAVLVAGRDSCAAERGLHLAVATMAIGERAHVWASPAYGWGPRGNFSFPTIPPDAAVVYDIELVDFEPLTEGKTSREMTYEERLEASSRRRAEGNAAFKEGRYADAAGRYSAALSFVDEDLLIQLQGFHYDRAIEERVPALLNAAACHLKLGDNAAAVNAASQVLAEQPGNAKALFRRGAARHAIGQTEAAVEDLKKAAAAAPGDAAIARELAAVRRSMQEERRAGASLFKGLIDKAGKEGGGLYSDEEEEVQEEAAAAGEGEPLSRGAVKQPEGWFAAVMRALCPFIFGREKPHSQ
jgi:tetratricopeptide (TPR) repeat protein